MKLQLSENGTFTVTYKGKMVIGTSPIGTAYKAGVLYAPLAADWNVEEIKLHFSIGSIRIGMRYEEDHICLTILEADHIDAFVFGPYTAVDAVKYGELLGAGWSEDGSVVCIQSLNPKTVGGCDLQITENKTGYFLPCKKEVWLNNTAWKIPDGTITLQCTVKDMSRTEIRENNAWVDAVEGEDGIISGASIALTAAASGSALLDIIENLERKYGLPHPTIDGEWAKKSPKTSEIYFVINNGSPERQIELAEQAGVHCLYFQDPFQSWGHFDINRRIYPGGFEEFKRFISYSRSHGVDTGFHTLSNFIHTYDPYVSPVPHQQLLIRDKTVLCEDLSETDVVIPVQDKNSYGIHSTLNALRIGDEVITFGGWDEETKSLTDCHRGAYGTKISCHKAGESVFRLWDHHYGTLFPSMTLQNEVAANIGHLIRESGIRRISFDGLEGCSYTGRGEYACSEFVRKVFEVAGSELLCDASISSHYRWHAHSYYNWGEPYYDDDRRGGMYNYRAANQDYFHRNLLPGMLGWYQIWNAEGEFEPTTPEVMEYILSRTVAFDAGAAISIFDEKNGMLETYLHLIKLWSEFRAAGVVPDEIKKQMQEKKTDWHLERKDGEWILSELDLTKHNMRRGERVLTMESGTTGYGGGNIQRDDMVEHRSNVVFDRSSPSPLYPDIDEPLHFRIRVGYPDIDHGTIQEMKFCDGWFGKECMSFQTDIMAGDYLEYTGGMELYHYDCNLHLKRVYTGNGHVPATRADKIFGVTIHYTTEKEASLHMELTAIRTKRIFRFPDAKVSE